MLEQRKNVVTGHSDTDNDGWSHLEKTRQRRIEDLVTGDKLLIDYCCI